MKRLLLLTLLLGLSFQVACTTDKESTTRAAKEPVMTDSDLKSQIETRINSDVDLKAADLSISADADHNSAKLSGTVESEALRTRAVEMARAAHPGLVIEDKIDVKPRELTRSEYTPQLAQEEVRRAKSRKESIGDSADDAWIHAKIVAKLIGDWDTPERKINVDVNNNMVTLRGTVDSANAKAEAERIAKETEGVKRVSNQLKVVPKAG